MLDRQANGPKLAMERRDILRLCGSGLVFALGGYKAEAAEHVVATEQEPHHHIIMQNDLVRVMRVLIPPGEATEWHEHHYDYVTAVLSGSKIRTEAAGDSQPKDSQVATDTVDYGDYQGKSAIRRVTNLGTTLYHQIAFEILRKEAGGFGKADRSAATAFALLLDKPRLRAWRLKLDPGVSTATYTQNGPALRVVLGGDRLIETRPGEWGRETELRSGTVSFMPPATRVITNAAATPLDLIEFELR